MAKEPPPPLPSAMSAADLSAAVKWPELATCYDWLSLDRRGCWRLKGQIVSHAGLINYINRHYGAGDSGNWILRNGAQTVFVSLEYTPIVLRLEVDERLTAHTGTAADPVSGVYLDEEGNALLHTALGIGLLDDRDLPRFADAFRDASGEAAGEGALLAAMNGREGVFWRGLPLQAIKRSEVALRFRFQPDPAA